MAYFRRKFPHWMPRYAVLFVTWRLAGSLPAQKGWAFQTEDERLHRSATGPFWLRDPKIANMVQEALQYGEAVRQLYDLYAWCIMPNHVHVVLAPSADVSNTMQWLNGRTARVANRILRRSGSFWDPESFDHWIRNAQELRETIEYVEYTPVCAGLVQCREDWQWSSFKVR